MKKNDDERGSAGVMNHRSWFFKRGWVVVALREGWFGYQDECHVILVSGTRLGQIKRSQIKEKIGGFDSLSLWLRSELIKMRLVQK